MHETLDWSPFLRSAIVLELCIIKPIDKLKCNHASCSNIEMTIKRGLIGLLFCFLHDCMNQFRHLRRELQITGYTFD